MIQTTKNIFVKEFLFMEITPEVIDEKTKYRIRFCIAKDLFKTTEFVFDTREEAIEYYNEQSSYPSHKINKEQIEYKIQNKIPKKKEADQITINKAYEGLIIKELD